MNTSSFRNTLIEIAEETDSNLLSKVIAYYYPSLDFSSREKLFESLLNRLELLPEDYSFDFVKLKKEIEVDNAIINVEDFKGKDYRIKEIEMANLRGIPQVDVDKLPYGISLLNDDSEVNNAIILANNGVGKSSVFAGLEMIYAQEIGEKKLRTLNPDGIEKDQYYKYLQSVNNTNKPICKVRTVDGDFDLENNVLNNKNVLRLLNPQSHFISEYDVIRNGQITYNGNHENTIHNIVAESLGLDEYLNCLNVSEQIPSYRRSKEKSREKAINLEIKENNVHIINNEVKIKLKEEKLTGLNENIKKQLNDGLENNITKPQPKSVVIDNTKLSELIEKFMKDYEAYSSIGENEKANIERGFLDIGEKLLHDHDNCPFCQDSKLTLDEIKSKVEERLNVLNKLTSLSEKLTVSYKEVIEKLFDNFLIYNDFSKFIEADRSAISPYPELKNVVEREGKLYISLIPLVNDEELFMHIKNLANKTIPTNIDFNNLANLLSDNSELFSEYLDKLNQDILNLIENRDDAIKKELAKVNNDTLPKAQLILNIKNEIKELKEQIDKAKTRNIELNKALIKATKTVGFVNQIKDDIEKFNVSLNIKVNEIVETSFKAFKEPIEEILNDYFNEDSNLELKIYLKDNPYELDGVELNSKIIVSEIVDKSNPDLVTTPDQYFNTFRYKLFSLMVGLSIALASRKKYKVNLPLVIDDLFYGSDFVSKNTFAKFIQDLIILYYKHTPRMPLQIILFTHDNFIFKNAIEGIKYLPNEYNAISLENTIKSRMFPPKDKEGDVSVSGFKYWNLLNK
ncbi:MAG: hypothetical protein ACWA42_02240 [Lutibacter sp.]